jgi:hypothetical protein
MKRREAGGVASLPAMPIAKPEMFINEKVLFLRKFRVAIFRSCFHKTRHREEKGAISMPG